MTHARNETAQSDDWHREDVEVVKRRIALAALDDEQTATRTLGGISLHAHQHDAVMRLKKAIAQFGGALLADEVGLGKTYAALALTRDYDRVTLLAPAAILAMWRNAIRAAEATNVSVISVHSLSRRDQIPAITPAPSQPRALVIVDEAHYLRTRTTRRYARAAQLCAGHDVLLLSATPVHNNPTELRSLLALFMGSRADVLHRNTLEALIVRRTHQNIMSTQLPTVVEHAPLAIPDNPPVLEALLALPPPLPARDGKAAGALIRLGLLRAWCSSDAALSDTLRKRRMRGESLLHALAHGRYPTKSELRTWTTGTDSIQLGFPELLVSSTHCAPETSIEHMIVAVTTHLSALEHLERIHLKSAIADASRSALLRAMLHEKPHTPVLAFSQFASTVNALFRALSDVAGIAALTSHGGRVAGGPIGRNDLISRFAPRAHERPPPPAHEAIRLLLTTDMLSEGVNLQDAGRLVHLDLPWTEASRAQRVGRLVRIGSLHERVHVHSIAPPPGADRTLRIVATLSRKAGLSHELVGNNSLASSVSAGITITGDAQSSAADSATQLRETLKHWIVPHHGHADDDQVQASRELACAAHESIAASITRATQHGWIASVHDGQTRQIWANINGEFRSDSAGILAAIECIRDRHTLDPTMDIGHSIDTALTEIHSRLIDATVNQLNGPQASGISGTRRRILQHITRVVANASSARRTTLLRDAQQAEQAALRARGIGGEQRLEHWLSQSQTLDPIAWLSHWRSDNRLSLLEGSLPANASRGDNARRLLPEAPPRVFALLVLIRVSFNDN